MSSYRVKAKRQSTVEALLLSGRVTVAEALDRAAVERALAQVVEQWAAQVRKEYRYR